MILAAALAEIQQAADAAGSDPILDEVFSGACIRALANARDSFNSGRAAYDNARAARDSAVLTARAVGLSWGEIGRLLGVSKQQLHRRFKNHS